MQKRHRLSLQHLQYLEVLVQIRSVTRAADEMGISQSAMSTALARMRTVVNDPLLVATSRGMEPTPRAMDLARRSRDISAILEGRSSSGESFVLAECVAHWKIMASDMVSCIFLPPLMKLATRDAPMMRFTASAADIRRLHDYLRDGDFDLALTFVRNPAPDLRQVVILPQRLVCIARKGHPNIDGTLTLEQFTDESHVRWSSPPMGHSTVEALIDEALQRKGVARRVTLLAGSMHALPEVAAQSDLLAVVPEKVAISASAVLPIQVLTLPFKVPLVEVSAMWHERMHNDPGHKWVRQTLIEIARDIAQPQTGLRAGGLQVG